MPRSSHPNKPKGLPPSSTTVTPLPPTKESVGETISAPANQSDSLLESDVVIEPEIEVLPADLPPADLLSDEVAPSGLEDETIDSDSQSSGSGLVVFDPLEAYLRELRRYPHLTREEETSLAQHYVKTKDVEAAYKLISSNLWLVVKIAKDYERAARNLLDLIQEGNIGLMEAVKNFDPYRGVRLPSYAVWWIKAYIIRYIIANWRLVKIGTTQAQRKLFFNLKKEKDRLEREGFSAAPRLLAERLDVKESEVIEMEQRLGNSDVSADASIDAEGDTTLYNLLPAPEANAEEIVAARESQQRLSEALQKFSLTLRDKERAIFQKRMLGEDRATLQEMSDELRISRERVRQLENRIQEKLKAYLEEHEVLS